jgi:hypothetical protein
VYSFVESFWIIAFTREKRPSFEAEKYTMSPDHMSNLWPAQTAGALEMSAVRTH